MGYIGRYLLADAMRVLRGSDEGFKTVEVACCDLGCDLWGVTPTYWMVEGL
jgi:hypothetical protein